MKNLELECLPDWRYCRIPYGEKGPRDFGWNKNPLTLDQIPNTMNIGVILGTASNGLCALDFDGPAAWTWWDNNIGIPIPDTVAWASGRIGRCQMAFRVPEAAWEYLEVKKINLGVPCPEDPTKTQGFEFRWSSKKGVQSVLPPSMHPDTKQQYFWINPPSTTNIAELPDQVLTHWINLIYPASVPVEIVEYPPATTQEVEQLAAELKKLYPTLDGYDTWTRVTWAFCNTIGYQDGITLMKYYYPEQTSGEYAKLNSKPPERKCGIGTIKKMIKERSSRLSRMELELKKKYNI